MPAWAWMAIIGAVQVIIIGLITALRRADQQVIAGLEKEISKIWQWSKDKEKFDHEFRHDEYGRNYTIVNADLHTVKAKVEEHARRLERIDHKLFNGVR
jgi:hypothetical protein